MTCSSAALMAVLLGCMAADYVSGVVVAWMGRSLKTEYGGLSSKVGAVGLAKKGLMLMVVLIAALLNAGADVTSPFTGDTPGMIEGLSKAR